MNEFLTPSGLAERLVQKTGVSMETARQFAAVFFKIVRSGLKEKESFSVYNFGTFKKTWIESSRGINPATGEKIEIPAHWRIKFVPCAAVARRINHPYAHLAPKVIPDEDVQNPLPKTVPQFAPPATLPEEDGAGAEDEFNDEYDKETGRKPLALLVAVGIFLLALIMLFSLLIRGCVGKKSADERRAESTAAIGNEAPAAAEEVPLDAPQEQEGGEEEALRHDSDETAVSEEEADDDKAAAMFRDYTIPEGSSYHAIAAKEYGDRHLWPYLYMANKARNPDPDAISARDIIQIPDLPPESERRKALSTAVLEAYNAYLLMIERQPDSPRNEERRRRAVRAIVSGEILNQGFIDEYRPRILPEYAEAAGSIVLHQYRR